MLVITSSNKEVPESHLMGTKMALWKGSKPHFPQQGGPTTEGGSCDILPNILSWYHSLPAKPKRCSHKFRSKMLSQHQRLIPHPSITSKH